MKGKIRQVLASVMSLTLLFQANASAQEIEVPSETVTVTIESTEELDNLKAEDEFQLIVTMENTLNSLIQGTHHLVLRETVDGNVKNPVKLCNIPASENNNEVKAENGDDAISNSDNLQRITLKNLEGKQKIKVEVDCKVPENLEGKDIEISAVLAIDPYLVLGSAEKTVSVAPSQNPEEPNPAITVTDIQFPDADPYKLKKSQEFQVAATIKNTGNTSHPYVHFGTGISNEDSNPSTTIDFGTLIPSPGIQLDKNGVPYIESMKPGDSLTFTVKGKLPTGITAKNPYLVVAAVVTDGLDNWEEEDPFCKHIKSVELAVAEDTDNDGNANPPGQDTVDDNKNQSAPETKPQSAPVKKAAKTGDESGIAFMFALMILSGSVLIYGRRKIKQH